MNIFKIGNYVHLPKGVLEHSSTDGNKLTVPIYRNNQLHSTYGTIPSPEYNGTIYYDKPYKILNITDDIVHLEIEDGIVDQFYIDSILANSCVLSTEYMRDRFINEVLSEDYDKYYEG